MQNLINNRRSDLLEEYEQEYESYNRPAKRQRSSSVSSEDEAIQGFLDGETPAKILRNNFVKG